MKKNKKKEEYLKPKTEVLKMEAEKGFASSPGGSVDDNDMGEFESAELDYLNL